MPTNIEGFEPPYICEKAGCRAEAVAEYSEIKCGHDWAGPLRLCREHDGGLTEVTQ